MLTLKEHKDIANKMLEIKRLQRDIYWMAIATQKIARESRAAAKLYHSTRSIEDLRVLLDDELARSFPDVRESYYYATQRRSSVDQNPCFGQSGTSPTTIEGVQQ